MIGSLRARTSKIVFTQPAHARTLHAPAPTRAQHVHYSAGDVVAYFAQMALGGPLIGAACGLVSVQMIKRASRKTEHSDAVIQLIITICCAYLSFFLAESEAGTAAQGQENARGDTKRY